MTRSPVVAVVDDDRSVRRALRRVIQADGYTVETFEAAEGFLDWLPQSRPACLVLDIFLDGMSGFDLQNRLAADGVRVPIIFMTAHDDPMTRERVEKSGTDGYLWKPFDDQALLGAIRRAVQSGEVE